MQVRVLFFGLLKDIFHRDNETLELAAGATVADLIDSYRRSSLHQPPLWNSLAIAINQQYATSQQTLHDGDEVALLPPVSGGVGNQIALTRDPISTETIVATLKHPEDGAIVVFDGIVRNHTRERRTLYLDYEAYEDMALAQMRQLVANALHQFAIRDVVLIHRLGKIDIGETSVLIVVASAHRAAAFDACRWLIDTLKKTVPIWKKEFFEDGAVWAAGEPFPTSLRAGELA
jgi:molybdopterin synthase catalytic subunit